MARKKRSLYLEREAQFRLFSSKLPTARLEFKLNTIKRNEKNCDGSRSAKGQPPGGQRRALHQSTTEEQQQSRAYQESDEINLIAALDGEPRLWLLNGVSYFQVKPRRD
jgi:hypothetical protein